MPNELKKQNRARLFVCPYCKIQSETIGVTQSEIRYYVMDITTRQWEDFGEEDVKSQTYFCDHCEKKIEYDGEL